MSNVQELPVVVTKCTQGVEEFFEATVQICGVRPTKLVRKATNTTRFGSRSAITVSAKSLAKTLGFAGVKISDKNAKAVKATAKTKVAKTPVVAK